MEMLQAIEEFQKEEGRNSAFPSVPPNNSLTSAFPSAYERAKAHFLFPPSRIGTLLDPDRFQQLHRHELIQSQELPLARSPL